ncbi:MAG: hypothetical protein RLZZ244_2212 [Verrucomicrobiota bacterium]|jgi:hypothetical protein
MREDFDKHDRARFPVESLPANATPVPAGSLLFEPGIEMSEARQREAIQGYYATVKQLHALLESEFGPRPAPSHRPAFPEARKRQKSAVAP